MLRRLQIFCRFLFTDIYLFIFLTKQAIDKFVSTLAASSIYQKGRKLSFCIPTLANFDTLSVLGKGNWILYDFRAGYSMRGSSLLEQ